MKQTKRQIPGQLKMLMTPREIVGQYSTHIGDRKGKWGYGTDEETMEKKRRQNAESGLTEDVRLNGVQFPVGLGTDIDTDAVRRTGLVDRQRNTTPTTTGKPMLTGGHHRLVAALDTRPDDLIPVLHHKDILEHQGYTPHEGHYENAYVRTQGGTVHAMPKVVGMKGYETRKIAQPWGPYR